MGKLLDLLQRAFGRSPAVDGVAISAVGSESASCPSCNATLVKFPLRKIACPHCGQPIYSRTRPSDGRKVLLSEAQAAIVEEQWAAKNGTLVQLRAERSRAENARDELRSKFGRNPSENDVRWKLLNEDAITHASDGNIGLYRNTRFEMSELLRKEGRGLQSLHLLLAVCYLDANGPQNTSGWGDMKHEWFSLGQAFLAPGILGRTGSLIDGLGLSEAEVYQHFLAATKTYASWPGIVLSPDKAWKAIWGALNSSAEGR